MLTSGIIRFHYNRDKEKRQKTQKPRFSATMWGTSGSTDACIAKQKTSSIAMLLLVDGKRIELWNRLNMREILFFMAFSLDFHMREGVGSNRLNGRIGFGMVGQRRRRKHSQDSSHRWWQEDVGWARRRRDDGPAVKDNNVKTYEEGDGAIKKEPYKSKVDHKIEIHQNSAHLHENRNDKTDKS